jgi:hypothetical protein
MCFELYYLAMSGTLEIFNSDGIDTFIAILLLVQNIYVFLTVSLHAAYVGEEANKGFDIVKNRGIRVDDNLYIRCLIRSLQVSYQEKIQLTGGNYFAIDKPFIVTVSSSECKSRVSWQFCTTYVSNHLMVKGA